MTEPSKGCSVKKSLKDLSTLTFLCSIVIRSPKTHTLYRVYENRGAQKQNQLQ